MILVLAVILSIIPNSPRAVSLLLADRASSFNRYVDMGVTLNVVVRDPDGFTLVAGAPKLRVTRTHNFGGIVDTKAMVPSIVGASKSPVVWYCSEDQEKVLLYDDPKKPGQLAIGSEGAGKTTVLAMWHVLRNVLPLIGERKELGQTAPTETRLAMVRLELFRICPSSWYKYVASDDLFIFCDGTRLRLVSSYRQSKSQGSPIQGFNWAACGRDEGQDQVEVHSDIESRGRSAFNGTYRQLITATRKEDSSWRTLNKTLEVSGLWETRLMLGTNSPFVHPEFWEEKKRTMTPREYAKRVLAQDNGVELAVYYCWNRDRNLSTRTQGLNVTSAITTGYKPKGGGEFVAVAGHDPGNIYNTTIVSEFRLVDGAFKWVVVGEKQTKQTTAGMHAAELKIFFESLGYERDGKRVLVFCDPHGRGETRTDYQTVYTAFHKAGLETFTPSADQISRKARVGIVNRLLCNAKGESCLLVSENTRGEPVAPELVRAFESMQKKEGHDDPEGVTEKDAKDLTHAPAALGYLLWPFERELLSSETHDKALALVRKYGVKI